MARGGWGAGGREGVGNRQIRPGFTPRGTTLARQGVQMFAQIAAHLLTPAACICIPPHISVLPGGRGHRQITQNRPYKNIICGEKLVAVKVAVGSNKVLC